MEQVIETEDNIFTRIDNVKVSIARIKGQLLCIEDRLDRMQDTVSKENRELKRHARHRKIDTKV